MRCEPPRDKNTSLLAWNAADVEILRLLNDINRRKSKQLIYTINYINFQTHFLTPTFPTYLIDKNVILTCCCCQTTCCWGRSANCSKRRPCLQCIISGSSSSRCCCCWNCIDTIQYKTYFQNTYGLLTCIHWETETINSFHYLGCYMWHYSMAHGQFHS